MPKLVDNVNDVNPSIDPILLVLNKTMKITKKKTNKLEIRNGDLFESDKNRCMKWTMNFTTKGSASIGAHIAFYYVKMGQLKLI